MSEPINNLAHLKYRLGEVMGGLEPKLYNLPTLCRTLRREGIFSSPLLNPFTLGMDGSLAIQTDTGWVVLDVLTGCNEGGRVWTLPLRGLDG